MKNFLCIFIYSLVLYLAYGYEKYSELSKVTKRIVEKVAEKYSYPLDIISSNKNFARDFKNKIVMDMLEKDPKLSVKIQTLEAIKSYNTTRRGISVIVLASHMDFGHFNDLLTAQTFSYFIFVDLNETSNGTRNIFRALWKQKILNAFLIHKNLNGSILVQTFSPFRSPLDCSNTQLVTVYEFKNLALDVKLEFPKELRNLHQCPIFIAVHKNNPPYTFIHKLPNGTNRISGTEYELGRTLASALNFKIKFIFSSNPTADLQKNLANISLGANFLALPFLQFFDASVCYKFSNFVFIFAPSSELTSMEKLVYPLSLSTWICLISFVGIGYAVIFIAKLCSKSTQDFIFGSNVKYPYFNMWIGLVGLGQTVLPQKNFARFLLISFLLFCLVIRNGYQGKMFELMQSDMKHTEPKTIADLVDQKYKFIVPGGKKHLFGNYSGKLHFENATNSFNYFLWNISSHGGVAYLGDQTMFYTLSYLSRLKNIRITSDIFLTTPLVAYAAKNFFLLEAINEKIGNINSAGLQMHWYDKLVDENHLKVIEEKELKVITIDRLIGCFQLWCSGLAVSVAMFSLEILKKFCKINTEVTFTIKFKGFEVKIDKI